MALSKYILKLGRPVAYYPGLKKITNSTTATILLCQFIYWADKAERNDGWIYKTAEEIEEETGLTYYEQTSAREKLIALGILEEERKRLDHTTRYRVIEKKLNALWEKETASQEEEETPQEPVSDKTPVEEIPVERILPQKKDAVDMILDFRDSPGMKKLRRETEIQEELEKRLTINIGSNKKWKAFIGFLYVRESKYGEPAGKFIDWALKNGWDARFWTPEKMQLMHPQAYLSDTSEEEFISTPVQEEIQQEEFAPMPKHLLDT